METIETELRPTTADEFTSVYWREVERIAKSLHRRNGTIEPEDIVQGTWERVLARFEQDFSGQDSETVKKRLARIASQVMNQESLDYMYFTGSYLYSPAEVRVKLATCVWDELKEVPDVDARMDLKEAFENLPPKQRLAVYKVHGLKEPKSEMSKIERNNEGRGVDNICHYLNRGIRPEAARLDDELTRTEVEGSVTNGFRASDWTYGEYYGGDYR